MDVDNRYTQKKAQMSGLVIDQGGGNGYLLLFAVQHLDALLFCLFDGPIHVLVVSGTSLGFAMC